MSDSYILLCYMLVLSQETIDCLLRVCKKYGIPNGEIYELKDNPGKILGKKSVIYARQ